MERIPTQEELFETNNVPDALVAVAEGRKVHLTLDDHYNVSIIFENDGSVVVNDGDKPSYKHEVGNREGSLNSSIDNMRETIEMVKKMKIAIPAGNLKKWGLATLTNSLLDEKLISECVTNFDNMTPEEQENFRNTFSDKRK